jgi:hypothetical protein
VPVLAVVLAFVLGQPPAWIQRAAIPGPIVTWRAADVLGTPAAEGIVVSRDPVSHTVTVHVVDSRFDPPRVVKLRDLKGSRVRWLRAARRDGLRRSEIAVGVLDRDRETAYLLQIGSGLSLRIERTVRGPRVGPRTFVR